MLKVYCPECNKNVKYTVNKNVIKEYKGYDVNVEENIANCSECNEDIFVAELEEDNLKRLYDKYRELSDIVTPEEILKFRGKYNISQRELVAIMDWGKMTINRYENGSLPSAGHADLLKLITTNDIFLKEKVNDALDKGRITIKTYNKVNESLKNNINDFYRECVITDLTHREDEYNGFRSFDIERMINLISYVADKVELYKTSLNKYLWYIDFENFKHNLRSMTGTRYMKYHYGPIVEKFKYEEIINNFNDKFYKEEVKSGCQTTTKIVSKGNYNMSIFKESEIKTIDSVIEQFKGVSCSEISRLSHAEKGWLNSDSKELISYNYAEELNIEFMRGEAL